MSIFSIGRGGLIARNSATRPWIHEPLVVSVDVKMTRYPSFTTHGPISIVTRYETSLRTEWSLRLSGTVCNVAVCGLLKGGDDPSALVGSHTARSTAVNGLPTSHITNHVISILEKTDVLDDALLEKIIWHLSNKSVNRLGVRLKGESITTFEAQLRHHVNTYTKLCAKIEGFESSIQIEDPTRISDDVRLAAIRDRVAEGSLAESDVLHQADIEDTRRALEHRKSAISKLLASYCSIYASYGLSYVMDPVNEEDMMFNTGLVNYSKSTLVAVLQQALDDSLSDVEDHFFSNP